MPGAVEKESQHLEKYKHIYEKNGGLRIMYELPITFSGNAIEIADTVRKYSKEKAANYSDDEAKMLTDTVQVYIYNNQFLRVVSPVFYDEKVGAYASEYARNVAEYAYDLIRKSQEYQKSIRK
ncbi:MAG: hypothetical protein QW774_00945 [Candidatus Micrarchaeaceae archaeon]